MDRHGVQSSSPLPVTTLARPCYGGALVALPVLTRFGAPMNARMDWHAGPSPPHWPIPDRLGHVIGACRSSRRNCCPGGTACRSICGTAPVPPCRPCPRCDPGRSTRAGEPREQERRPSARVRTGPLGTRPSLPSTGPEPVWETALERPARPPPLPAL